MKKSALRKFVSRGMLELGFLSFAINLLLLTQPIYMLQVYDRVLPAASLTTLLFLSVITLGAVIVWGLLDSFRQVYATRLAARFETELGARALLASSLGPNAELGDTQPLRDLATVRAFVGSRILQGLFDLPFVPIFLILLVFIHPYLFVLTIFGVVLVSFIAWLNQRAVVDSAKKAAEGSMKAMSAAQSFTRNAETIRSMGMVRNTIGVWGVAQSNALVALDENSSVNAFYGGLSRSIRQLLQIAIMGLGAWLVIDGKTTAGMIFATSMISGRALQPIDQLVGGWRQIWDSKLAWDRLNIALTTTEALQLPKTDLPEPKGEIIAENLIYSPPSLRKTNEMIIKRISFGLPAGESVALVGPSGAGKSTLARLLCGAIDPTQGSVRIDRADIRQWDRDRLGKHIGYLPQDADMMPGTIAQNIARFSPDAKDEDIVMAAKKAQVHEMILGFPGGYGALLGPGGMTPSGGQRQRIGLARAFFGSPKILILDEPNSNLDGDGDAALDRALVQAKADKITVVLVTQRKTSVDKIDRLMIMRDGQIEDYGPREKVVENQNAKMREMMQKQQAAKALADAQRETSNIVTIDKTAQGVVR